MHLTEGANSPAGDLQAQGVPPCPHAKCRPTDFNASKKHSKARILMLIAVAALAAMVSATISSLLA
jgi:hypothetical protein